MQIVNIIRRSGTFLSLAFLSIHALAAPPAQSSCPPILGERDNMMTSVANIGFKKRIGHLCAVPQTALSSEAASAMKSFKPCLDELGVRQSEIVDAMSSGESAAQEIYEKTDDKSLLCRKTREEYK
jgi:hypothetical protein